MNAPQIGPLPGHVRLPRITSRKSGTRRRISQVPHGARKKRYSSSSIHRGRRRQRKRAARKPLWPVGLVARENTADREMEGAPRYNKREEPEESGIFIPNELRDGYAYAS
ncbi:hypothetical protein MRX96_009524 [Rhipicephalus microplus]